MNYFDFSEVKDLFKKYQEKYAYSFTAVQTDLANEFYDKLEKLNDITDEIADTLSEIYSSEFHKGLIPDENDVISFMGMKIKLQRADPNIPIGVDNVSTAYSKNTDRPEIHDEIKLKERKLERLSIEFYQAAHRMTHIAESLPKFNSFKLASIRNIRNHLIEHPEGKASGITHDSFSYSLNEGPYVKGLRIGDKTKHMDRGFKINVEEFISTLKKILLTI